MSKFIIGNVTIIFVSFKTIFQTLLLKFIRIIDI